MEVALALDVGGTKLAAGVVNRAGELLERAQLPTPQGDAEAVFSTLCELADRVLGDAAAVCGVGCGGPMTAGGETVSPLNIAPWRGFKLRSRLASVLGLAVFVDNDAKALALGEGWVGAAAGRDNFLAMVVSTGVGGGIVVDGRVLDGRLGNAGHIGHVVVEPDGRPCTCGGFGCLEAEASGLSIQAVTGRPPKEATGDVVVRTGTLVGRAIASVANLLDLDLALVGGSVALGFGAPFFDAAQAEVDARARLSFSAHTRVERVGLGDAGPLIGAAAVGWRGLAGTTVAS